MIILGLGSNLGDRLFSLRAAVDALSEILADVTVSRVYESAAVLPEGAPASWDAPYYNIALSGFSDLHPEMLLSACKDIEKKLGRIPRDTWAPREIDIDILAVGDLVLESEHLNIPHALLLQRNFTLLPLADIAPEWAYPVFGPDFQKTAAQLIAEKGFAPGPNLQDKGDLSDAL